MPKKKTIEISVKGYHGYGLKLKAKDKRKEEFHKQRITRGHDNSEIWNLDVTIAKFILPRLKTFKDLDVCERDKIFHKRLDLAIAAFEIMSNDKEFYRNEEQATTVEKGLTAFTKIYFRLWT